MAKLALTNLSNLQNENTAVSAINANNAAMIAAMENTLSRNGSLPNDMDAQLDMDSNRIINLPTAVSVSEPITLAQMNAILASGQVPNGLVTAGVPVSAVMQPFLALTDLTIAKAFFGFFATRTAAAAATIHSTVTYIQTMGYSVIGDGGAALYTKTSGSTTGGFQSVGGQWWELNMKEVSPKMFGAPWDGSSDDGPAIQLASNYLNTKYSGGMISLPPAVGAIFTPVVLADRVSVQGQGWGNTSINVLHTTANVFTVGAFSQIRDFKFVSDIVKIAGACIKVGVSGGASVIEGIRTESTVPKCFWNVVEIGGAPFGPDSVTVKNCYFNNPMGAGILVTDSLGISTIDTVDCAWQGTTGGGRSGIEFTGGGDFRIYNCQVLGFTNGIHFLAGPNSILFNDVFNCTCDHNIFGCVLNGFSAGVVQTRFTNCQFTASTFEGVKLSNNTGSINGVTFINCTFQYNGADGLKLYDASCINIRVIGGEFATNTGSGVRLAGGVTHFMLINSRCGDIGGALGNGVTGITIDAGCENFIVTGNDFTTTTGGAFTNTSGTSATKIFSGNIS